MRPTFYETQWKALQGGEDSTALDSLARRIASSFIDRYFYNDEYDARYIRLLCEMATQFDDPELNQIAARALFGIVIERLCDDFEELQTETYNRLISQVTDFLCKLPAGANLDSQLRRFDLKTEEQLFQRIEHMRLDADKPISTDLNPRKVLVLSRVTIGADVAITSILCQRMLMHYPEAEIVVIGNDKLHDIFAAQSHLRVRELDYTRRGGLLERFAAWLVLLAVVEEEVSGLSKNDYLLLDPDSRLTQLGALPLVPAHNYRFFNSRGKRGYPENASISALTNLWLDNLLGPQEFCYPKVWLAPEVQSIAKALLAMVRSESGPRIITVNLGVGGNARKRVSTEFELELVLSLLEEPENVVILDRGFGEEELARSEAIVARVIGAGYKTQMLDFAAGATLAPDTRLLGIQCGVGEVAALIAQSDEFIGYDSACQHIAAALGIKTFTVFAGTNNARFIHRWHATGPNTSEILYVDTISRDHGIDTRELLARLHDLRLT